MSKMILVYNENGTINFLATKAFNEKISTEEGLTDIFEIIDNEYGGKCEGFEPVSEYDDFWNDECWKYPPGHLG